MQKHLYTQLTPSPEQHAILSLNLTVLKALEFIIMGNIQKSHAQTDACRIYTNTNWHANTAERKGHSSKLSRHASL